LLKPEYQDKGYGTEAASAFLSYFRDDFGLKNICAIVSPSNDRSNKLMGKLGFERGGDVVLQPWGVYNSYVFPGMVHLSKETAIMSRWGVEK
jgi:RimJ/RimL family protein N-acetyltransferase